MSATRATDEAWMGRALELARGRLGRVAPNPAVACLLVHGEEIVGEGATGDGGRPHAEEIALEAAGARAAGATVYVTLEPCTARSAATLSCAERLAEARVSRVVIACEEPNPLSAKGHDLIRSRGIATEVGVLREEAAWLNRGFFKRVRAGRPWVAIDAHASSYDALFDPLPGETFGETLDRLGAQGLTRVRVPPGTDLARTLSAENLVDEILA